ncbi:MAG: Flavin containing amine oxidoreductase [Halonotius sp. J07HN4]|nr:MAG: Flavin containing amine oxidoreductase [Halonotius sp. J07HN4]
MSRSVVVIGGGLAGLVAARHLAAGGADVTLYEADETVGGRVTTQTDAGYTLDRGFQVLITAYPAVQRELDLDALDLRRFSPGATIARPDSRSVLADPLGDPTAAIASLRTDEVTTTDKLRTLALRQDLATRAYDDLLDRPDASIREWLAEWGFSEKYVSNFIAPFYGGITLDRSLSTSKRVFEYTFKALSDGDSAVPADGMAAIPRQLAATAADAGATIQTDEGVTELRENRRRAVVATDSDRRAVDAVVVATSPRSAARLTGCESIPTEGIGCVTQHYRLPDAEPLDTGKRLLLNAGDAAPNTVVPMSTVAPDVRPRRHDATERDVS